jgi:hypothetical protein
MSNKNFIAVSDSTRVKIYTSEQPETTSGGYLFNKDAYGYVISTDAEGISHVSVLGSAKQCITLYATRSFYMGIPGDSCIVNGVQISNNLTWTQGDDNTPSAFARITGDPGYRNLEINMAENGYFCIDNVCLVLFEGITLNPPVSIDIDESGVRSFIIDKNIVSIYHGGREVASGGMLKPHPEQPSKFLIDKNARVTEDFYIKLKESDDNVSFTDIVMKEISIPTAYLPETFSGSFDLLSGFRATTADMPSIDKTIKSVDLQITRFNGETATTTINISWMSSEQEKVYKLYIHDLKHWSQETEIDFSEAFFSDVKSIEGEEPGIIELRDWSTTLSCVFKSGESGFITIYREAVPYKTINAPTQRFSENIDLDTCTSIGTYMVNGRLYKRSVSEKEFTTIFDGTSLTITPRRGITSFGLYNSAERTWTLTSLKKEITFDPAYRMAITSNRGTEIKLADFGTYDESDTFNYFLGKPGTKEYRGLLDKKYKLEGSKKAISSGTEVATLCFTAVETQSGNIYTFDATFVFEEFNCVFFIIPGRKDFDTPPIRRVSFAGAPKQPFWMYGKFVIQAGKSINSYGNKVSEDSYSSSDYPIVKFETTNIGTVIETDGALDVCSEVTTDDVNITINPGDEFIPLNQCSEVIIKNSVCKVPKSAGTTFFRLGNKIYLMRPEISRKTKEDEPGPSLSRRGSFRSTSQGPERTHFTPPAQANQGSPATSTTLPAATSTTLPAATSTTLPAATSTTLPAATELLATTNSRLDVPIKPANLAPETADATVVASPVVAETIQADVAQSLETSIPSGTPVSSQAPALSTQADTPASETQSTRVKHSQIAPRPFAEKRRAVIGMPPDASFLGTRDPSAQGNLSLGAARNPADLAAPSVSTAPPAARNSTSSGSSGAPTASPAAPASAATFAPRVMRSDASGSKSTTLQGTPSGMMQNAPALTSILTRGVPAEQKSAPAEQKSAVEGTIPRILRGIILSANKKVHLRA